MGARLAHAMQLGCVAQACGWERARDDAERGGLADADIPVRAARGSCWLRSSTYEDAAGGCSHA